MTFSIARKSSCLLLMFWQLFALTACQRYERISVPEQKVDFIGRWSGNSNFFELKPDGGVNLEIEGTSKSFLIRKGSLRRFEGEIICVGVGERQQGECLSISGTPYVSEGREVILVEGVELARE